MLRYRVIPTLLLLNDGLVKTRNFKKPAYIGDPINAVRIFNDKEVDELIFLDISATRENRVPHFNMIKRIASEAFMPFGYGGGVKTLNDFERLFTLGVEKVIVNSAIYDNSKLISEAARIFGSQSIVAAIDAKRKKRGNNYECYSKSGRVKTKIRAAEWARRTEELGVGEIFINSIDKDGEMNGYDLELVRNVAEAVTIPVIASGGAGSIDHFVDAINIGHASAVAAGAFFVFHGVHRAVLISYPKYDDLERRLSI